MFSDEHLPSFTTRVVPSSPLLPVAYFRTKTPTDDAGKVERFSFHIQRMRANTPNSFVVVGVRRKWMWMALLKYIYSHVKMTENCSWVLHSLYRLRNIVKLFSPRVVIARTQSGAPARCLSSCVRLGDEKWEYNHLPQRKKKSRAYMLMWYLEQ